jgi:hypothetical protein
MTKQELLDAIARERARFDTLAEAIVGRLRLRSDDEINAVGLIPWSERTLGDFVAGDILARRRLHANEIERAIGRIRERCWPGGSLVSGDRLDYTPSSPDIIRGHA